MSALRNGSDLRARYLVELDDGEVLDIQTEVSDVLRWERTHGGEGFLVFPLPISRVLWVIWRAAVRQRLTTAKDPDLWIDSVRDFEPWTDEEENVDFPPTETDQSGG